MTKLQVGWSLCSATQRQHRGACDVRGASLWCWVPALLRVWLSVLGYMLVGTELHLHWLQHLVWEQSLVSPSKCRACWTT